MKGTINTIALLILLSLAASAQNDWPMLNGGPQRRNWAENERSLKPPFQYVYDFLTDAKVGNITQKGNLVCFGIRGAPNKISLHRVDGQFALWTFDIPGSGGGMDNAPAISESLVLGGGQQGSGLFALNIETGRLVWHIPIGSLYNRHPIIDDNRVYISGHDTTFCFDLSNGETIWAIRPGGQTTPTVDGNVAYVDGGGITCALNKYTGVELWRLADAGTNAMAVDENYLYRDSGPSIQALNKNNGSTVWTYNIPGGIKLPNVDGDAIAVSDKHLCAVLWSNQNQAGEIFCLNKTNGALLWRHEFTTEGAFTPTIANDIVYVVNYRSNKLFGFDAATGTEVFADDNSGYDYQPIVAGGALFVSTGVKVRMFRNDPVHADNPPALDPSTYRFTAQYPNPAVGTGTIKYRLETAASVRLSLFDSYGRLARILSDGREAPGEHHVIFDTKDLAPGMYVTVLSVDGSAAGRRMVIMR